MSHISFCCRSVAWWLRGCCSNVSACLLAQFKIFRYEVVMIIVHPKNKILSLINVTMSLQTRKALVHLKEVVHLKKLLLIIYSPPCHPRCPCLSFFSRQEIKVF